MKQGAYLASDGACTFTVWAPDRHSVVVKIGGDVERRYALDPVDGGYWTAHLEGVGVDAGYRYILDGTIERPDPASRRQPDGVHGASAVVDHRAYAWRDALWRGLALRDMVIYEIHVGTFTPPGTFAAIVPRLDELADLGVNAIELMPVAAFPGDRNWGYDAVYPYAVQESYGGPDGLKLMVDEAHARGIAVIVDVVYNHLGPEGNYLNDFGPYVTDRYRTPWGSAVNFDGSMSDHVRRYFVENALMWLGDYHADGLRVDAVHGIFDFSATPFLDDLARAVGAFGRETGRRVHLIAESDLNDARIIRPREQGGLGFNAQWNDDYHHCIHALLTGERAGYYEDFGETEQLAQSLREGFVYTGQYSRFRKRRHGNSSAGLPREAFVVFSQNHDQTGNRMRGERLSALVSFEGLKLAAGAVILSPFVPLLFMGEEYGEDAPFAYFTSHDDPALIEAVRQGRRNEFAALGERGQAPDSQDAATFMNAKLSWERRDEGRGRILTEFYRRLIGIRRNLGVYAGESDVDADVMDGAVVRWGMHRGRNAMLCLMNFSNERRAVTVAAETGVWIKEIDSADEMWWGPRSCAPVRISGRCAVEVGPLSIVLYARQETT